MTLLKNKWGELLSNNISNYAKARPKRGIYIERYLKESNVSSSKLCCLEQGAFSAKDSVYLKEAFTDWYFTATDTEVDVVDYICSLGLKGLQENAFQLSFDNEQFDITFQSGLIVLFDDSQAKNIIQEQLRVTSSISFVFAHNQHNYIDRFFSFLKQKLSGKKIFTYRCYTQQMLTDIAVTLNCKFEVTYHDNMLVNFCTRNCSWLLPVLTKLKIDKLRCLANELVLVIYKC